MRELPTLDLVRRIVKIATGDTYGDGMVVTNITVGYAEPGYGSDDAVIVFGDWNDKRPAWGWYVRDLAGDRFPSAPNITKADTLPGRLARVLEAAGAHIEWLDEWVRCGDCYRAFRSQGDSYQWTMYGAYSEDGCDYFCADCLKKDPEDYLSDLINEPTRCSTFLSGPELVALGFEQENGTFENGWHEGQDDNPTAILDRIHHYRPDAEVVFILTEQSQFYLKFAAYVRTPEQEDDITCSGHESTSGPIGTTTYCDGSCLT